LTTGIATTEVAVESFDLAVRFETETSSPKYGALKWSGYIRGDRLEATVFMMREGKAPLENWVAAGLVR
jgi:hypothetical protein